jgi:hypothetical protein
MEQDASPWPEDPETVRRKIRSVVESVIHEDELSSVELVWGPDDEPPLMLSQRRGPSGQPTHGASLWARVIAEGEEFCTQVWREGASREWSIGLSGFASQLEDWVPETRFAWGEQRFARLPSD